MLAWAVFFLLVSLLAGAFGLFGIAGISATFAWVFFVIFLLFFFAMLLASLFGGRRTSTY